LISYNKTMFPHGCIFWYTHPSSKGLFSVQYLRLAVTLLCVLCLVVPHIAMAADNPWEVYRSIRLKSEKRQQEDPCVKHGDHACSAESSSELKPAVIRQPAEKPLQNWGGIVHCPASPDHRNNAGVQWYLCSLQSSSSTFFTPYGKDFPLSYMTPREDKFTADNPARIRVFLHPDENGSASYATGPSSFAWRQDTVEIHPVEQQYGSGGKFTGWWGYSGNQVGAVANYNGRQIAAAIDYVRERYGDRISLSKGIYLVGKSLGGAGVMHQSMILPKYQDKIAIVDGIIAKMMIPKNDVASVQRSWGPPGEQPTLYGAADIRKQWQKVQGIHFHWRGGSNDNLGRFDLEFINICEKRKISCSLTWLQSGHGTTESGYSLNMDLFTDPNQDVTLDEILPVITNNTSNHHGKLRGYHNRGVTWNYRAIEDLSDQIVIPLQYKAMTNLGPDLPDQPKQVTFSVTPRHVKNFPLQPGKQVQWKFGMQQGVSVVASDGLATIDGLKLVSGEGYRRLEIRPAPKPAEKPHKNIGAISAGLIEDVVYTRVPRTVGKHSVTLGDGSLYTSEKWDFMDSLPEVARQFSGFNAPGQLVLLKPDGKETIIYDCMKARRPCVPLDPMPSLDGKKIAFSVLSADCLQHPWPQAAKYPSIKLCNRGSEAKIYLYDISEASLTPWPHSTGIHDISPIWLPDGRIMFGSDRGGFFAPFLNKIGTSKAPEPRLYIADADGSNVVDITPHEITAALHPYLLDSGRVAYSSQWLSHNLPYNSTNGGINWPGTTSNFWSILDMDSRGGDMTALLGAHRTRLTGSNPRSETAKALHFLGQRVNHDICTVNYYRGNNLGLGDVVCWPPEPVGVEGDVPNFVPRGLYSVATWSTSEDAASRLGRDGKYLGKVGWPEGTGDNQLILSVGQGYCTQVTYTVPGTTNQLDAKGRKGCDVGLYKTTVIPSRSPDDLQKIVDDPAWHEFGARVIRPRDVKIPDLVNSGDGTCQIASSDAGSTDSHNYAGYRFNNNYHASANNGGEIDGLPHNELAAIRFYQLIPNTSKTAGFKNSIGNRVKLLGDVPLLADNSFKARLPCDTPYIMAGVDKDGRLIKRDQVPQSLRPGEKRVCTGCHLHSKVGRPYEQSMAFTANAVPLLTTTPVPSYERDIRPVFEARCSSCHKSDLPLMDYEKLVWDYFQQSVPVEKRIQVSNADKEKRRYGLQRPYTSKYVNSMYARESLLYWKAANRRTDGRSDGTYPNDIDFGPDHPTDITGVELKAIGDWLDSGAAR